MFIKRIHLTTLLLIAVVSALAWPSKLRGQSKALMQPEDCFKLRDINGLAISPDGSKVVFVQREASLKDNKYVQSMWVVSTFGDSASVRLTDSEKDGSPVWSSDGSTIDFLSTRGGSPQVWSVSANGGEARQVTNLPSGVTSFKCSPDGKHIALVAPDLTGATYAKSIADGRSAAVIQKRDFVVYRLLSNQGFLDLERISDLWLFDIESGKAQKATDGINVVNAAWSPDSSELAVEATARHLPSFAAATGIYLYKVGDAKAELLLAGRSSESFDQMDSYSAPIWSPDGQSLAVMYVDRKDRWSALDRLGIYSFANSKLSLITTEDGLEFYNAAFHWFDPGSILFENTSHANRGLFRISTSSSDAQPVGVRSGYNSQFSFSSTGKRAAFVRQSQQQPPEIFVADYPFESPKQVTNINAALTKFALPETERVHWKSKDGTEVEGWLFKPLGYEKGKRCPLLVMVHGGPGVAISDRFEPYGMDGLGWAWPYPYRIFTEHGYAVFFPNYRGTGSYGKRFRSPNDIAKQPSEDIITGIDSLIARGVADPKLIGIMGQSHGGWLGPYVMAHDRIFRAASFAEGGVDLISTYGQMPGWLNRNIHEYYYGAEPYTNPSRYIELSPMFAFKGLETPTLLEYGEQSLAVQGIEFDSALWREGVPNELVIYPKTGHNLAAPVLQLESMKRNVDWFDYWMLGKEDSSPEKRGQYERWKKMADEMREVRSANSQSAAGK